MRSPLATAVFHVTLVVAIIFALIAMRLMPPTGLKLRFSMKPTAGKLPDEPADIIPAGTKLFGRGKKDS